MIKTVQYNTSEERQQAIDENSTLYLIEERNITEGKFLIFSDTLPEPTPAPIIYVTIPQNELNDLKQQISDLNLAMAAIIGGAL